MIFILLILLIAILIFNLYYTKFDYIAPNVVFTSSFVFSTFMCSLYYEKWNVNLNFLTFLIILLGNILFSIICIIMSKREKKIIADKKIIGGEIPEYKFNKKYGIIFIVVGIITLILTALFVTSAVGMDITNLRPALYAYRDKVEFRGENLSFPLYLNLLTGIMHAGGYWFIALFLTNFKKNHKINWIVLINIILCLLSTFLEGSRSMAISYILFAICYIIFLVNYSNNFKKSIKFKSLIKIFILGIMVLATFRLLAIFVGRDNTASFSTMDYIALYTGAEIKNLDTYLIEENNKSYQYGKYTFSSLYSTFSKYLNLDATTSFPFRYVNGYKLGNVYTIFYHFYMDLGIFGVIIFSTFMGFVAQILYNKAKKSNLEKSYGISLIGLIYCYSFSGIFYSFFSNQFFSLIFSMGFIKYLIVWYLFNLLFIKNKMSE